MFGLRTYTKYCYIWNSLSKLDYGLTLKKIFVYFLLGNRGSNFDIYHLKRLILFESTSFTCIFKYYNKSSLKCGANCIPMGVINLWLVSNFPCKLLNCFCLHIFLDEEIQQNTLIHLFYHRNTCNSERR